MLTFFSNTIRNRALTEVATTAVTDGSIVAKVRGTGTVVANGITQVTAGRTVDIQSVMVKSGQDVNAGDVLFVLGAGESEELEAAREELRSLEMSYQRAVIGLPSGDYSAQNQQIKEAEKALEDAKVAVEAARSLAQPVSDAKDALDKAQSIVNQHEADLTAARLVLVNAQTKRDNLKASPPVKPEQGSMTEDEYNAVLEKYTADMIQYKADLENAEAEVAEALTAYEKERDELTQEEQVALSQIDKLRAHYESLLATGGEYVDKFNAAVAAQNAAQTQLNALKNALKAEQESNNKAAALTSLELQDLNVRIEKLRAEIKQLSGEEGEEIVAKMSGRVESVECAPGQTVSPEQVLCSIEVPDMGYSLSFSVTNDQARRLRIGDSASVNNYYWGREIIATITSIKTDPKNPQGGKILEFDITGDVNAGSELTVSIGQKSASYDLIVPNSAIRTDSNGSFVLVIEAKNSPLGNMYMAKRVNVEVLATDDVNSAVTGELSYGDFVITTSNGPVKSGDQVRMADNDL
ncbi:MAG: HlyD family efflux transporter periplasmic adaptor subunit [Oscillospiraceae bacterium]|nr:HlyD family efflux transporter periplasmic adaptor subunit [Oscillospiraceae bacterium]